jgi:hypothetical protein
MAKRLITLMAALLMLGFVAAGCGDDDSSGDGGDTATQTVTETITEETGDDNGGGEAAPRNVEEAVEQCKQGVASAPQLSDDTKDSLEDICERAGSGDEEDIREAAAEVCREIVEDTIPSGTPGRGQALDACDSNAGQ